MSAVLLGLCGPASAAVELPPLLLAPQPLPPLAPPPSPAPEADFKAQWNLRGSPANTRTTDDQRLFGPLARVWSVDTAAPIRSVVLGGGSVFARSLDTVLALEASRGREMWRGPAAPSESLLYEAGRVITSTPEGVVARSSATGAQEWASTLPVTDPPAGAGGLVILHSGRDLVALSAADGKQAWRRALLGNDGGTITIARGLVVIGDGCGNIDTVGLADGAPVWQKRRVLGCTTPGDGFTEDGRYHVNGILVAGYIHDLANGAELGAFQTPTAGAVAGAVVYASLPASVEARPIGGAPSWVTRTQGSDGRGLPLVAGGTVFATAEGTVSSYDRGSGRRRGTIEVPGGDDADNRDHDAPLAAAGGLLVAEHGGLITSYRSLLRPAARGIALSADRTDIASGDAVRLTAALGVGLRGEPRIVPRFQLDRFPYERSIAIDARIGLDGLFMLQRRITRNTRVRATGAGGRSKVVTIRAYPRIRFGATQAAGNGRAQVRITVSGPRDLRVAGRRLVLYLARSKSRAVRRLGAASLKARGRTSAVAEIAYRLPSSPDSARAAVCIVGLPQRGFGANDAFARRCGAVRLRLSTRVQ